jgi:hypothetical protein
VLSEAFHAYLDLQAKNGKPDVRPSNFLRVDHQREANMFSRLLLAVLICTASISVLAQTPAPNYQRGTITAATAHQNPSGDPDHIARYDVSVKIGNTVYVVLFTPPNGSNAVEYSTGIDMLFLVGNDTLTFNSMVSGKTEMPILRRQTGSAPANVDLSGAPSQYFSLKLKNLSEKLTLSDDQQARLRPILEQESGELSPLWSNPVISQKDKLETLERVVRASDEKIRPILSQDQWEKLQDMRKEQKVQLKKVIADKKADK